MSRIKRLAQHWELALYVAIMLAALALRLWDLGARAYHHDESLHATYSWYLFQGRGYVHDPMMHGPFQFFGNAVVFFLAGDNDYTGRLLYALFGTALVGLPYFLRGHLGKAGALIAATLLALSPSFLYFSRFARNDIYVAVWTLGLVICLWRFLDTRKARYLYGFAALLGLSFATKEVIFITVAILGLYLLLRGAGDLVRGLRHGFNFSQVGPAAALVLLLGTLTLPQLSAAGRLVLPGLGFDPSKTTAFVFQVLERIEVKANIMLLLFLAALVVGLRWHWRRWLLSALIFYGIFLLLYSSFFSNWTGLLTGLWGSLDYWLAQQDVQRGGQPWFYYLMLLAAYEFLPLLFALPAVVYYAWRGDDFSRFLIFWLGMSLILYSYAGEKMPWLTLHMALPLILLAARFLGHLLTRRRLALTAEAGHQERAGIGGYLLTRRRLALTVPVVLAFALLLGLTARTSLRVAYTNGDTPVEMLVYTQTSADVPKIRDEIDRLARETGLGPELKITVDGQDGFAWPWVWYLRDYKRVGYPTMTSVTQKPDADVVLLSVTNEPAARPYLDDYGQGRRFRLRWWFPEWDTYRAWTPRGFLRDLARPSRWEERWDYFWARKLRPALGSSDAVAYFPKDFPTSPLPSFVRQP